ncbi:unnamed protein product [Phytophthora fragariaefolia]|uniref:Unnamed protein product n=1 Tax=Phytophthora fragariaefolia TaxID=1490495 RepID=A0A9W7CSD9_9STRA|nr:unnamed protein product [Phytophthora fragariaefolia]
MQTLAKISAKIEGISRTIRTSVRAEAQSLASTKRAVLVISTRELKSASNIIAVASISVTYYVFQKNQFNFIFYFPSPAVSSELPVVAQMIHSRHGQLTHKFDEATLHNIVAEFNELRREYDVSNKFCQAVKESDKPLTTFDDMWAVGDAASKFPTLAGLSGGFASVFPNTAPVESDFSVINCKKSDKRTSLADLSFSRKHRSLQAVKGAVFTVGRVICTALNILHVASDPHFPH